jgi:hypothetical protein
MVRPQVTDGADGPQIGGQLPMYWISSCGRPTGGDSKAWRTGGEVTTPRSRTPNLLRNVHLGLGPGGAEWIHLAQDRNRWVLLWMRCWNFKFWRHGIGYLWAVVQFRVMLLLAQCKQAAEMCRACSVVPLFANRNRSVKKHLTIAILSLLSFLVWMLTSQ